MAAPPEAPARPAAGRGPARLHRSPWGAGAAAPPVPRAAAPGAGALARKAGDGGQAPADVTEELRKQLGGGAPLPAGLRRFMEPRFGADFGDVRVHTDKPAARLSLQVQARAFAFGRHIFFGPGQYQPDSREGRELIAHELTHTIQQKAVVQRQAAPEPVRVSVSAPEGVHRSIILDKVADLANAIPGFRMFTIVIGVNPINMAAVEATPGNILRALIEFLPGGGLITQALDNSGIFDKAGNWVAEQVKGLGISASSIIQSIKDFIDSLGATDLLSPGSAWERGKRVVTEPIGRIIALGAVVVEGIIKFVKEAILKPIGALAAQAPGYDLLKAVIGKDPVTDEPVADDADAVIGGFMKLIGKDETYQNMKKANAGPRVWAWFKGALAGLKSFVLQIPPTFVAAFKALELADIILVPRAFAKLASVFGGFLVRFISWAGEKVWDLAEIIFDVVSPGALTYVKKTGAALKAILMDPLPFVGNLVKAGKLGFTNFAGNFLTHLKNGLLDWLTGSLPGIYIPKAFTLGEIVKFVLSVLGLTWANVRAKLVAVVGETAVSAMEKGFDIVKTLVTQGPAAAWEQIKAELSNLQSMVISGITSMVVEAVVEKAIPKLIAMFIPGAGFISAILSIYDTVMVFVQKISKIIQVVTAFIDSIVNIAAGNIASAASRVENILAGLLTLAINFLAGFAGLGKVADKIMGVVAKIRAPIDKGLDALVKWIVKTAKALFAKLTGKDKAKVDTRTPAEKQRDLDKAKGEAEQLLLAPATTDPEKVRPALPAIGKKYGLTAITLEKAGQEYDVVVEINPRATTKKKKFNPMDLKAGDTVLLIFRDPNWLDPEKTKRITGVVVSVDLAKQEFRWKSTNVKVERTALLTFDGYQKTWDRGHVSQQKIPNDVIEEENKKQQWGDFELARAVLNYRQRNSQFNEGGKQWEHIIERSAGGANSSGNLALTAATLNNDLGRKFGQPYASHEVPSNLSGTEGKPLRQFLQGKSLFIQNQWKAYFYAQAGVGLKWKNSSRGMWRELN